jgi:S1-C subfamily serine protease
MRFHRLVAPVLLLSATAALPAQTARIYSAPSAGALRIGEDQPRAALGISTAGSTSLRDTLGVLVAAVVPNSPAERAGIQEGDRIASINGVNLRTSPADAGDFDVSNSMARRLTRELNKLRPGDDVDLRVYSEGRTRTVRLRSADSDSLYARRRVARSSDNSDDRPTLGLGIGATNSRRDSLGVLVMFVDDSGPAARAGIEEGNRIAAIDDVDLRVARDDAGDEFLGNSRVRRLQREVAKLHPGDNVDLRLYANGDFRTVRLRVARAADLPHRHSFTISGDGMGMGMMAPGMLPFNVDGALIGEQVRTAIERAMEASGRALEGVGRGLNRNRSSWQDDDMERPKRVAPREPKEPMEPMRVEPLRMEPLEPSRLRIAPMKHPFTSVLLDDSTPDAPMVSANAILRDPSARSRGGATLDIAGLRLVPVGTELAAYLGTGSERGLLVIEVPEWARNAVREGDVVLSVEGTPVRPSANDIDFSLPRYREAQLDILRDRVHHSVTLPARR